MNDNLNADHNRPQDEEIDDTFCMDESYRMDDNSNYSTTALEENKNIDDPLIPGVGVEEPENE